MLKWTLGLGMLTLLASPVNAQNPPQPMCDQRLAGIRIEIHAPNGEPVADATVEVRLAARPDTVLRRLTQSLDAQGGYIVLDDSMWQGVEPTRFLVTASRGARRARMEILVGPDASGCHITLVRGPRVLALR